MSDKEYEIPVKVVDRRWWVNQDGKDSGSAPAGSSSLKPTYVEELERQLADKDQQLQETLAKYRQASNEFDEARLRLRREIAKDIERARREILADLLEVVDNLDRALDAARSGVGDRTDALLQGVDMVHRQFLGKLESLGVTRILSHGERFDPSLHEAIVMAPTTDAAQDHTVGEVFQSGYRFRGGLLRPARVQVMKHGS